MIVNETPATLLSCGARNDRAVHLHTDEGACLTVERAMIGLPRIPLAPGQRVRLTVPSTDVKIASPRLSPCVSGNEWAGRVLASQYRNGEIVVTVKIVGQPLTLVSTNISDCVHRPIQPEDQVRVSIEAAALRVVPFGWPALDQAVKKTSEAPVAGARRDERNKRCTPTH
ncbi:MAG: TOBE domain-containing protein [Nitrospira sp.]|nr:TOBE domain-containing protein [Nitrospira sp.]